MMEEMTEFDYIVVGGGISGVTCAESIAQVSSEASILLLSASPLIKAVTNFRKVTRALEDFDIEERPMFELHAQCPNITVREDFVTQLSVAKKEVSLKSGETLKYGKLCICSGGTPKLIAENNPYVLGIRDTETVKVFQQRLAKARRVIVVGNGGIATELVYEVEGCEVIWAIKDASISSTFIDAGAATFFLPHLLTDKADARPRKRTKYMAPPSASATESTEAKAACDSGGSALGPDWHEGLPLTGVKQESHQVYVEYEVEVVRVLTPEELSATKIQPSAFPSKHKQQEEKEETDKDWPIYMELTNGKVYGCDFVVSATGVVPNTQPFVEGNNFELGTDGGLLVDNRLQTSEADVYAAGDVCTANWTPAPHWIQMRLWSQARQMGAYAARSMLAASSGEKLHQDFCFELFAHVTKFFNYKVVLLGKFNAQGLGDDHDLMLRCTKGLEYVKVVMRDGRMQGALLVGETDLEETFENLILNQTDLTVYGEDLLDPNIDIEDYFD